jgi:hypothetical protein
MADFLNRAKMTTSTEGTGTITLLAAVTKYQTWAAAGAIDGKRYAYVIEDGNDWEIGEGVYSSSGPTLTREVAESSNSGSALDLSGNAQVFNTPLAKDIGVSLPGGMTKDPKLLPVFDGTSQTIVYNASISATASSADFWTEIDLIGAYATGSTDNTFKEICDITGSGLLFHVISQAPTNATDDVAFRITVDGVEHTITKTQTLDGASNDQRRVILGACANTGYGSAFTANNAIFYDYAGGQSDTIFLRNTAQVVLMPPAFIWLNGWPSLRFEQSLKVEAKVGDVYTAGTYGAYCGATYILD